jgi:peptidoglycan-associated lipoprotein
MKMGKTLKTHIALLAACILLSSCSYTYYLNSGKEDYNNLMYAKAKGKFNKGIQKKPESYEVLRMLALTLQKMKDYEGAEKAFELAMNYPQVTLDDKYNYATLLMSRDKHTQAEAIFREYIAERPGDKVAAAMLESCQFIELFRDDTTLYKIEALPLMGNFSMFSPVAYGDGVVYTAERPVNNGENPWTGNSYNDIYYATSSGDGFSTQQALAGVFNGKYNDGPIAFNTSQDYAVFTRSNSSNNGKKRMKNEQNYNNLFLYSTQKVNDVWTTSNELSFNSEDFSCMHPALSRNGDTLYFSSDMDGGHGLLDLYMSTFNGMEWTEPQNLGTVINTAANDVFPAIGPSGELFFSSDGHPSLGSLDIFKSEREDGVWRKPINLNYPINSTNDDFAYNIADSTGYFSSNREGIDKVYKFKKKPSGKVYIYGTAMTSDLIALAGVEIVLMDMETGEIIRNLETDADGKFDLELQPDKLYKIEGKKEGFFSKTYERSTVHQYEDEDVELVFEMKELIITDPSSNFSLDDKGIYEVDNIYYDFNSDEIRADAALELDKLIQILFDNPTIVIELHSHTDARGTEEYNNALSDRRAKSAKAYMLINGVDPNRIGTRGYGESRILNKCKDDADCTEEEHEQNRRTEFIVTKV